MLLGTRILFVETPNGTREVPVRLFNPEPTPQGLWDCRYEIGWPEGEIRSHMQGKDELHVVHLAMEKIGSELYLSRYHHERKMWWNKPWVGYGFPLPKGARDLLIGHDQEYYGDESYGKPK